MAEPWRLINMKVKVETLDRIDAEARRLGLTRTAYMVQRSDPKPRKANHPSEVQQ